jgi:DNA polymerase-1
MKHKKLIIIDGLNSFYRSYIVDPSISSKGIPIGGLKGFVKQIQKFAREMNPDEVVVVWDGEGGSSRRKKVFPGYKEGRSPIKPKNLEKTFDYWSDEERDKNKGWQLGRLFEYLNLMPVKQLYFDNVEADDIIAVVAQSKVYSDYRKIIISNDKDFYQLLNKETIIYRPATKKFETSRSILAEYKIHPNNFAIARAMAGDKSDNLAGVERVGLKTAAKLFPELSGTQPVYIDDLIKKTKSKETKLLVSERNLLLAEDIVDRNYRLMQLYSPVIAPGLAEKVKNIIGDATLSYGLTEIKKMMLIDGFGEYNWEYLELHCRRLVRDSKSGVLSE